MPAGLGCIQQGGEFGRGQEALDMFIPIRGAGCALPRFTLYTSPLGRPRWHDRDPVLLAAA